MRQSNIHFNKFINDNDDTYQYMSLNELLRNYKSTDISAPMPHGCNVNDQNSSSDCRGCDSDCIDCD